LTRGCPAIHHADQGARDAAAACVEMLTGRGAAVRMAAVGEPEEDGFAERLMRTIKGEEVDLSASEDLADARRPPGRFLDDVYNAKRIHPSPGDLTPAEFHQPWMNAQRTQSSTVA